jgi:hypothetical protein
MSDRFGPPRCRYSPGRRWRWCGGSTACRSQSRASTPGR